MKEPISVLIVDDDQQIINLLTHALKRNLGNDVRVIIAHDEASAMHSEKVDIALVEFSLPTMHLKAGSIRTRGLEIIRQLKEKKQANVIIAMSSCGKKGDELITAGADYFIADAYSHSQLSNTLKEIIKKPSPLISVSL